MIGIDELIEDGLLDKADKPKKIPVAAADFVAVCFPARHTAATSAWDSIMSCGFAMAANVQDTAALHTSCSNSLHSCRLLIL